MDAAQKERIEQRIRALHPKLVEQRRDLHRHPELAFEEVRTSGIVAEWCRGLGLDVRTNVAKTGVVAKLHGGRPGKTIALRADMDALPIDDRKTCNYASQVRGKMHACGHDVHVTMALGAATILASMRDAIDGDVVFLFQPAEEGPGGALPMIQEGALDGVDFIVGQHMGPLHETGEIAVAEGPAMAAADFFELTIVGRGGHGAYPHLSIDAIPIAAQVVTALQTIVSRGVDPLKSAVVSVGTIEGGYRSNVVADRVKMTGTTRSFDPLVRQAIKERVEAIVSGVVGAHGASYELEYRLGYPPLVNHKGASAMLRRVASELLGKEHVHTVPASMGGEDFAYYLEKIPGCFYWLGCRTGTTDELGNTPNIHHPAFDIDEEAIVYGVQLFVHAALEFLSFRPQASLQSG